MSPHADLANLLAKESSSSVKSSPSRHVIMGVSMDSSCELDAELLPIRQCLFLQYGARDSVSCNAASRGQQAVMSSIDLLPQAAWWACWPSTGFLYW